MSDASPELVEAIHALFADPADVVLADAILGTHDPRVVAERVTTFVERTLGARVVGCPLFTQSVGAVFGLDLDDGRRVVLKAYALGQERARSLDADELGAVWDLQARLARAGVPCAAVLVAPRAWPGGAAGVMGWLAAGDGDDPHLPEVRRAMARVLAELAAACADAPPRGLPRSGLPTGLYPPPHNALFDFDRPEGAWIDDLARPARELLARLPERPVVLHTDVSAANVRVVDGRVVAIYDMDSVGWIDEMRGLAGAAVHFTYRGDLPWTWPDDDEVEAFVADYAEARGRPLAPDERARFDAALILSMAYTARCEISLDPPPTSMQDRLRGRSRGRGRRMLPRASSG